MWQLPRKREPGSDAPPVGRQRRNRRAPTIQNQNILRRKTSAARRREVQQACTITQAVADEDPNILFGAVLDEKMKDSVKITVIAPGFKEADMRRPSHHENYDPVILSREISNQVSRPRDHFREPEPVADPEPAFVPEPSFEPEIGRAHV